MMIANGPQRDVGFCRIIPGSRMRSLNWLTTCARSMSSQMSAPPVATARNATPTGPKRQASLWSERPEPPSGGQNPWEKEAWALQGLPVPSIANTASRREQAMTPPIAGDLGRDHAAVAIEAL